MSKGYVYVLSNPSMPGIVKIGHSKHGGQGRADVFYKNDTAVPTSFVLEFEILCDDAASIERRVHLEFNEWRVNPQREFFAVADFMAVSEIMKLVAANWNLICGEWPFVAEIQPRVSPVEGVDPPDYASAVEALINDPDAVKRYSQKQYEHLRKMRLIESFDGEVH